MKSWWVAAGSLVLVSTLYILQNFINFAHPRILKKNTIDISKLQLKTGDLLFVCEPGIVPLFNRFVTQSNWNHVCIVCKEPSTGFLYVIESFSSNSIDLLTEHADNSIILTPLLKFMEVHQKRHEIIGVRLLNQELDCNQLYDFVLKNLNQPFHPMIVTKALSRAFSHVMKLPIECSDDSERTYCAKFVTECLVHMHVIKTGQKLKDNNNNNDSEILEDTIYSDTILPRDYSQRFENKNMFYESFQYSDEWIVFYDFKNGVQFRPIDLDDLCIDETNYSAHKQKINVFNKFLSFS